MAKQTDRGFLKLTVRASNPLSGDLSGLDDDDTIYVNRSSIVAAFEQVSGGDTFSTIIVKGADSSSSNDSERINVKELVSGIVGDE